MAGQRKSETGKKAAAKQCRVKRSPVKAAKSAAPSGAVEDGAEAAAVPVKRRRAPSVSRCAQFYQKELAQATPELCEQLLKAVREKHSLPALRLLLQLAGLKFAGGTGDVSRRDFGFARRLLTQYEAEQGRAGGTE